MTAALLNDLLADADLATGETTTRVWAEMHPPIILRTEDVPLIHCPACGRPVLVHLITPLMIGWMHTKTAGDYHVRITNGGLDYINERI